MMMIKNNIIKFANIIGGSLVLFYIIWLRFICERLPRDVPFKLTEVGFCLMLYMIITYVLSIKKLILPNKQELTSQFFGTLARHMEFFLFTPVSMIIKEFYKGNLLSEKLALCFYNFLVKLCNFHYVSYYLKVKTLMRLLMLFALCLDTFYYAKIELFYWIIPLWFLVSFILRMMPFILNDILEYTYKLLDYQVQAAFWSQVHNQLVFSNMELLTKIQGSRYLKSKEWMEYDLLIKSDFFDDLRKEVPQNVLVKDAINLNAMKNNIKELLKTCVYIYTFVISLAKEEIIYKKYSIVANITFLCCWTYILCVSLHSITQLDLLWYLVNNVEPFSETSLIPEERSQGWEP